MSENDNKNINKSKNDEDFDFAKRYRENFTPSSRSGSSPIVQSKIVNKTTKKPSQASTKSSDSSDGSWWYPRRDCWHKSLWCVHRGPRSG